MVNVKQAHRLVTHEDAEMGHAHKILGVAVLGHLAWRMDRIFRWDDSGLSTDPMTPIWLVIHALLHVTSFKFKLPEKRNKIYNVIWPEFRLHSMIFAYRSIICTLLAWLGGRVNSLLRGPLVMSTLLAADAVSAVYGQETTMRHNPYPAGTPRKFIVWHNRFYSVSQFGATMAIMFRGADSAFIALLPIQTAPLFMTLVKKGIINQAEWHLLYTLTLLTNWVHAIFGKGNDGNVLSTAMYMGTLLAVTLARLKFGINKYLIWSAVWALKLKY